MSPRERAWGFHVPRQDGLQRDHDFSCGLKSFGHGFAEAARDDARDAFRHARRDLVEGRNIVLAEGVARLDRRAPSKGVESRKHLVEHDAEGEDIGTRIGLVAADLLG